MELRQIRYALAVAEERHFTRAAQRLNVAQSALSAQVKNLEQELGTPLFERTSRQVRLTAAGEVFVARARVVTADLHRLITDVRATVGEMEGILAIGLITTADLADLPGLLREFTTAHPGVRIRLQPQASEDTIAQVASGELDLGLIGLTTGVLPAAVTSRALWTEPLVAVVGAGHPWVRRRRVRLADLAEQPLIDFPAGTGARTQTDRAFVTAGLTRTVIAEANGADLIADLARGEVGVGLLPASFSRKVSGLHTLDIVDGPSRSVHVIANPHSHSVAVQAFLDILAERLRRM